MEFEASIKCTTIINRVYVYIRVSMNTNIDKVYIAYNRIEYNCILYNRAYYTVYNVSIMFNHIYTCYIYIPYTRIQYNLIGMFKHIYIYI